MHAGRTVIAFALSVSFVLTPELAGANSHAGSASAVGAWTSDWHDTQALAEPAYAGSVSLRPVGLWMRITRVVTALRHIGQKTAWVTVITAVFASLSLAAPPAVQIDAAGMLRTPPPAASASGPEHRAYARKILAALQAADAEIRAQLKDRRKNALRKALKDALKAYASEERTNPENIQKAAGELPDSLGEYYSSLSAANDLFTSLFRAAQAASMFLGPDLREYKNASDAVVNQIEKETRQINEQINNVLLRSNETRLDAIEVLDPWQNLGTRIDPALRNAASPMGAPTGPNIRAAATTLFLFLMALMPQIQKPWTPHASQAFISRPLAIAL